MKRGDLIAYTRTGDVYAYKLHVGRSLYFTRPGSDATVLGMSRQTLRDLVEADEIQIVEA